MSSRSDNNQTMPENPLVHMPGPIDNYTHVHTNGSIIPHFTPSPIEIASKFLIFQIGGMIHRYWLPFVVVVGCIGNCLAFVVLLKPHNRGISCCLYMAALAVSDTIFLAFYGYWWFSTVPTQSLTQVGCTMYSYISGSGHLTGVVLILCITVDRFIAVRFPFKAATYCTTYRAKVTILIAFIFGFTYNIPEIFTVKLVSKTACASLTAGGIYAEIYSWVCICTNSLIPFLVILSLNIGIIMSIRNRAKDFKDSGLKGIGSGGKSATESDNQLAAMLLMVSFAFLILTLPLYVRYVYFILFPYSHSVKLSAVYTLAFHITNKLYATNSAVNFYLYCCGGRKFREDVLNLFSCRTVNNKHCLHST